ncbi:hypothetical protein CCUS01_02281 [Colletotrichum cuscutae]|uniref:Uncharacterized protein n=1 Tax=Colletotrichum cuscutae TaxID=1209917 RepID=A0AAI9XJ29_9PEZI|nr:hypothetical protein CCUS01_02281 [Colletotrichum cuscutae]
MVFFINTPFSLSRKFLRSRDAVILHGNLKDTSEGQIVGSQDEIRPEWEFLKEEKKEAQWIFFRRIGGTSMDFNPMGKGLLDSLKEGKHAATEHTNTSWPVYFFRTLEPTISRVVDRLFPFSLIIEGRISPNWPTMDAKGYQRNWFLVRTLLLETRLDSFSFDDQKEISGWREGNGGTTMIRYLPTQPGREPSRLSYTRIWTPLQSKFSATFSSYLLVPLLFLSMMNMVWLIAWCWASVGRVELLERPTREMNCAPTSIPLPPSLPGLIIAVALVTRDGAAGGLLLDFFFDFEWGGGGGGGVCVGGVVGGFFVGGVFCCVFLFGGWLGGGGGGGGGFLYAFLRGGCIPPCVDAFIVSLLSSRTKKKKRRRKKKIGMRKAPESLPPGPDVFCDTFFFFFFSLGTCLGGGVDNRNFFWETGWYGGTSVCIWAWGMVFFFFFFFFFFGFVVFFFFFFLFLFFLFLLFCVGWWGGGGGGGGGGGIWDAVVLVSGGGGGGGAHVSGGGTFLSVGKRFLFEKGFGSIKTLEGILKYFRMIEKFFHGSSITGDWFFSGCEVELGFLRLEYVHVRDIVGRNGEKGWGGSRTTVFFQCREALRDGDIRCRRGAMMMIDVVCRVSHMVSCLAPSKRERHLGARGSNGEPASDSCPFRCRDDFAVRRDALHVAHYHARVYRRHGPASPVLNRLFARGGGYLLAFISVEWKTAWRVEEGCFPGADCFHGRTEDVWVNVMPFFLTITPTLIIGEIQFRQVDNFKLNIYGDAIYVPLASSSLASYFAMPSFPFAVEIFTSLERNLSDSTLILGIVGDTPKEDTLISASRQCTGSATTYCVVARSYLKRQYDTKKAAWCKGYSMLDMGRRMSSACSSATSLNILERYMTKPPLLSPGNGQMSDMRPDLIIIRIRVSGESLLRQTNDGSRVPTKNIAIEASTRLASKMINIRDCNRRVGLKNLCCSTLTGSSAKCPIQILENQDDPRQMRKIFTRKRLTSSCWVVHVQMSVRRFASNRDKVQGELERQTKLWGIRPRKLFARRAIANWKPTHTPSEGT